MLWVCVKCNLSLFDNLNYNLDDGSTDLRMRLLAATDRRHMDTIGEFFGEAFVGIRRDGSSLEIRVNGDELILRYSPLERFWIGKVAAEHARKGNANRVLYNTRQVVGLTLGPDIKKRNLQEVARNLYGALVRMEDKSLLSYQEENSVRVSFDVSMLERFRSAMRMA